MGIRHLTQLEIKRLTGQTHLQDQIKSLDFQRLPYTLRRLPGGHVIGINAYNSEIVPLLSPMEWDVIRDETIGTGLQLISKAA